MKRKRRLTLFSYPAHDYKAAEDWLNEQAHRGWALDGFLAVPFGFARLVPSQRSDLRYCMELTSKKELDDSAYLALCRDAGWEECEVTPNKVWRIFRSIPGADPAPLQTEPAIELEHFVRKRLRRDVLALVLGIPLCALLCLPFLFLPVKPMPTVLFDLLSSGYGLSILLAGGIGLSILLWQIISTLRYWRRCRRSVREGRDFPTPGRSAARCRVWGESLYRAVVLVYLAFAFLNLFGSGAAVYQPGRWTLLREKPVVMAQDLGESGGELPCTLMETATPFYRRFDFEDLNADSLRTEIYAAATEPLARLAVQGLREGMEQVYDITFAPVALGLDESYAAAVGGNGQYRYLLLRQGTRTALLSGAVDWTHPDILGVLWKRLQLKE